MLFFATKLFGHPGGGSSPIPGDSRRVWSPRIVFSDGSLDCTP